MNCIVLEGMGLNIALAMVLLLMLTTICSLIAMLYSDNRLLKRERMLRENKMKVLMLSKENFRLSLKCGEMKIDETKNINM